MKREFNPGETAPVSAQYEILGTRGGRTGKERTVARGKVLPPLPKSGMKYRIADRTKNKSGHNPK